jgi:hypothetical protein
MFGIKADVEAHGLQEYPKEAVGKVVRFGKGFRYVPLENKHEDPENHFLLDSFPDDAEAIVHTHTRTVQHEFRAGRYVSAAPSQGDMKSQQSCEIPFGILPMGENGAMTDIEWFGNKVPIPRLLGRSFLSGIRDCWCLTRDFYQLQWGLVLPNLPRDHDWYRREEEEFDLLSEYQIRKAGFDLIDPQEARPGDVLIGSVASRKCNHVGILCSRSRVLHHVAGKQSCREGLGIWRRYVTFCARHKDARDWDGELLPHENDNPERPLSL